MKPALTVLTQGALRATVIYPSTRQRTALHQLPSVYGRCRASPQSPLMSAPHDKVGGHRVLSPSAVPCGVFPASPRGTVVEPGVPPAIRSGLWLMRPRNAPLSRFRCHGSDDAATAGEPPSGVRTVGLPWARKSKWTRKSKHTAARHSGVT